MNHQTLCERDVATNPDERLLGAVKARKRDCPCACRATLYASNATWYWLVAAFMATNNLSRQPATGSRRKRTLHQRLTFDSLKTLLTKLLRYMRT